MASMSEALDLVSKNLVNHHKQVAFLAVSLAEELGLSHDTRVDLAIAGILHDAGGLSLSSRLDVLDFEVKSPERHTLPGYLLLRMFPPFDNVAQSVRFHHLDWQDGAGSEAQGAQVPPASHILHLADRVVVLIDPAHEILGQAKAIVDRIVAEAGARFVPDQVEAFRALAAREAFWLDLVSPSVCQYMHQRFELGSMQLDRQGFEQLAGMLCRLIDFRSRFTVTHSYGVARVAEVLARRASFAEEECWAMRMAGYLHDIGKLAVPAEILEKKEALTRSDFAVIRKHPYFTHRILHAIPGLETITQWAALHHERLDGAGYPFHHAGAALSLGARVMAVADTFTALAEVRPYRTGMSGRGTFQILERMAHGGKLDSEVLDLIRNDFETINDLRSFAQQEAFAAHKRFEEELQDLLT